MRIPDAQSLDIPGIIPLELLVPAGVEGDARVFLFSLIRVRVLQANT